MKIVSHEMIIWSVCCRMLLMSKCQKFSFCWEWGENAFRIWQSSFPLGGDQTEVPISNLTSKNSLWQGLGFHSCWLLHTVSHCQTQSADIHLITIVVRAKKMPFLEIINLFSNSADVQAFCHLISANMPFAIYNRNKSSHSLWMMLFRFSFVELQLRKSSAQTNGASILK